MSRQQTFTFRVDKKEKEMIDEIAERLERSASDAVRLLIREAYKQVFSDEVETAPPSGR